MNNERVLILGAYGQLGTALVAAFPGAQAADRDTFDIGDPTSLATYDWSKIDVILNAAAYTNVDAAETTEGRRAAWLVNASAVANLAKIATEHNITLVHVSTEYVFDGTQTPHTETEQFSPLSSYGASKAAGDLAAASTPKHYILRTSWVIGKGKNFVATMLGVAAKNISPKVVHDQTGRLTFTATLVEAMQHLLKNNAPFGTYNVSNQGDIVSWADVTREIFTTIGRTDLTVTNISTDEYFKDKPEAARRPLGSAMDLSKIESTGLKLRDWRTDLAAYIKSQTDKE
ncbi:MAG TPA: NAD(P)-dependent oxidoreductase [Candidatus Saccharimonadales bacterium]|nr:NAD(P)-dependent oxidoreductase [Candidatus Saccharimonadales bacterium]